MASPIKPYKIEVPDSQIEELHSKLDLAKFPPAFALTDSWDYGTPVSEVERLVHRWRNGYDWRAAEARLNEFPQFTTTISVDGFGDLEIHFLHQKSKQPGAVPLLFAHGWPGSFLEVLKILPLLTTEKNGLSFDVVAPSLPNFGFSEGPQKPGFRLPQYAEVMHKVMLKLGYEQYVTQGGDWGFSITRFMGLLYPDHVLASHINMVSASPPSLSKNPWQYLKSLVPYTEKEKKGIERSRWFRQEGFGYNLEQATKPSTLGLAWADSPVALLSWILEKLHDWTDSYPWTDDEILTWISIYQFSRAGPEASARIYYEVKHPVRPTEPMKWIPRVKLGVSIFPMDLFVPPMSHAKTLGPVVFAVTHGDGGHFAAHERPEILVKDLREMFSKGGGAHDVAEKLSKNSLLAKL
ncbi:epoxide hydrolase [Colletotrichum navitas]|uniref:Epoxide hydrolase n=1 Tax=Colletotrichum navitas TaxID=681940 RepID=A0AAD8PKU7_9PEZI|nr:epoxide hydrolase [Colletotrichum navitas]KAK1566304.1 epoxide hydrolase [Colletotrichum navitas]